MTEMQNMLEALIDQHGLYMVLADISYICFEKAEHLKHEWQDYDTADAWTSGGTVVHQAAEVCYWKGLIK